MVDCGVRSVRVSPRPMMEKLNDPQYLLRCLRQYAREMRSLQRKLRVKPNHVDEGEKRARQQVALERLQQRCTPNVISLLRERHDTEISPEFIEELQHYGADIEFRKTP
ncbi:MAG: hypothetical protein A2731_00370 [Candidatus Buchananbacteria bacterium RIFCSPHIGHO2_01_FULL_39_8]|uniref:Uncharacterized protein n=1 Tax=Candidatus Buchananbacteria bacterium RIFCSPHIGHO2_01_FULL_39_8 TaxID=1797533 RepID=A0A1G1XZF5_9BACT|nr:MAG: hypothetical protein A2731_00370 [Candidatus Buchananbacteria bacterium RIFCSPHIGHO2_01_FULL_39_8]